MDQTIPAQPTAAPQPSPIQPHKDQVDMHSTKSRSYTPIFIVLLVLCTGIIGALFYQNQTLKQQAINMETTPAQDVTEIPLESPTVKPTASTAIVDNWKIYPSSSTIGLPYEFKYPPEFTIAEAQDRAIFTYGTSEFIHRWIGKTKDLTALLDTYKEFGAPKIIFSSRKSVSFGEYTGVKAVAKENASVYYFLGNPALNGFLVFIYDTDNAEVEPIISQIASTIVLK